MSWMPYTCEIGSLMHVMVCNRPNIAHAMSIVSRYIASSKKAHQQVVKWILTYLKGSVEIGLVFRRGTNKAITHIIRFCN